MYRTGSCPGLVLVSIATVEGCLVLAGVPSVAPHQSSHRSPVRRIGSRAAPQARDVPDSPSSPSLGAGNGACNAQSHGVSAPGLALALGRSSGVSAPRLRRSSLAVASPESRRRPRVQSGSSYWSSAPPRTAGTGGLRVDQRRSERVWNSPFVAPQLILSTGTGASGQGR